MRNRLTRSTQEVGVVPDCCDCDQNQILGRWYALYARWRRSRRDSELRTRALTSWPGRVLQREEGRRAAACGRRHSVACVRASVAACAGEGVFDLK
eukprot:1876923-Pleurochrysis_carterae.AAC.1